MNVNLGTVFDKFVAQLLKTGMYQSQSEVVREGLRLLKERIGSEQADRGEFVDGEVYRHETKPLQIIRVFHAARDVQNTLGLTPDEP